MSRHRHINVARPLLYSREPGTRFNRFTLVGIDSYIGTHLMARFRCQCGTEKTLPFYAIAAGQTKSCGCLQREISHANAIAAATKHGQSRTSLYRIWGGMIARCHNPNRHEYVKYGARGIIVCDEWRNSFEAFAEYMGPRPEGKSLDRFPRQDGNYEPGNVRWATAAEQNSNRRGNVYVDINGQKLALKVACRLLGLSYHPTLRNSIKERGEYKGLRRWEDRP